ncbi:alpha/beta fold hydrolase [Arthrobacter sp. 08Y14]|uniref:alpha/beta fold hydrolase n=1 Tax=Arthrobacter sp. 08Y14 TaxID=2058885 RepID=UPI000CE317EB|nr:alpha/beta hydrolase [Arthrobacter sp. 08Y14]
MNEDAAINPVSADTVFQRNNVKVLGRADGPALVLVQGFGCDQVIWDRILPEVTETCKVVLLDHVGTGWAEPTAYSPEKYASLEGYLADLLEVLDALELENATVVGHSVAGMMALAASVESSRIGRLVLLCASACYLSHDGYAGGFEPENVEDVLRAVEANIRCGPLPLLRASRERSPAPGSAPNWPSGCAGCGPNTSGIFCGCPLRRMSGRCWSGFRLRH